MPTMNANLLKRSSPEQQGISSLAILGFVNAVEEQIHDLHGFMLLRHGQVVAEGWWGPYAAHRPHMLFSLSKSFTSTAIGLAVAEGRLKVSDRVLDFFQEDAPAKISKNLAKMSVHDLLSMSTGHAKDATGSARAQKDGNWAKGFLALPVRYPPGTHFVYNSAATYMLSAIIQKLTGTTLLEYLKPRLFDPLGIENPTWETCPRGINTGGWGLSIRTEDIARFGQLYLQKGVWEGKQLVPEGWIAEATRKQVSNGDNPESDWNQGYGYQFWRCRHNAYRGDGAFGQYCIVLPEQDAVLAINSGLADMQAPLNIVWDCLLPEMQTKPLRENPAANQRLTEKLSGLALDPRQSGSITGSARRVSDKTYRLDENKMGLTGFSMHFDAEGCKVILKGNQGEYAIQCGHGVWQESQVPMLDRGPQLAYASGAWTAEDTYEVTARFVETPFIQTMTCKFGRTRVSIATKINVSLWPTRFPTLTGHLS
jgi:CubicO group peptidase (beta-lactamase class C family)